MRLSSSKLVAIVVGVGVVAAGVAITLQPEQPKPTSPPAVAPDQGPRGAGGPGGPGGPDKRPVQGQPGAQQINVGGAMKMMNRSLAKLEQQVGDTSKRQENLKLIGDVERGCILAKTAPKVRPIEKAGDDAAKTRLTETYRKDLLAVLRKALEVEDAIADGKTDAAAKAVQELIEMKDKGHKDLGIKDDED